MKTITIPKGDYGFPQPFEILQEDDLTPRDLTGFTVTLKVWTPNVPGTPLLSGGCVVDTPALGLCHYTVQSGNFATAGTFDAELELTMAGKKESTYKFRIKVTESP